MLFPISITYIEAARSRCHPRLPGCMCAVLQYTELIARHMGKRSKLSSKCPRALRLGSATHFAIRCACAIRKVLARTGPHANSSSN